MFDEALLPGEEKGTQRQDFNHGVPQLRMGGKEVLLEMFVSGKDPKWYSH